MNVNVLHILELKTSERKFSSVCTLGCVHNVSGCTITLQGFSASKQNFVDVFYV